LVSLLDGLLTGLMLQLAIGPVFFYILGITLESDYFNTLSGILGITIADFLYITLSVFGIGRVFQNKRNEMILGIISSIVLIIFGFQILYKSFSFINFHSANILYYWTPVKSFSCGFLLTLSNPLTILFWTGIFSARAIEKKYNQKQLLSFGMGAGFSTLLFLSLSMLIISILKTSIPNLAIQILNFAVALLLLFYGFKRQYKDFLKEKIRNKIH
jgi:threonine/homoserine/homoserine lactone efflux protein